MDGLTAYKALKKERKRFETVVKHLAMARGTEAKVIM
jgi:hypothetical protein